MLQMMMMMIIIIILGRAWHWTLQQLWTGLQCDRWRGCHWQGLLQHQRGAVQAGEGADSHRSLKRESWNQLHQNCDSKALRWEVDLFLFNLGPAERQNVLAYVLQSDWPPNNSGKKLGYEESRTVWHQRQASTTVFANSGKAPHDTSSICHFKTGGTQM